MPVTDDRARILLVEDDPATAELVGDLLTEGACRYEVTHAGTLADACTTLANSTPSCVMLDLGLPDADGLDGVQEIERLAPSVPIVVLTGREDDAFAVAAVKAGAQDYLMKGRVDADALRRAIHHAIERKRSERELAHRATHDPLTGLPNRVLLFETLRRALRRGARDGEGVALLFGDLDGFKAVNDTAGHAAGDQALVTVAERLQDAVGATDLVARFAGDEFAVVVRCAERAVPALVRRLTAAVSEPQVVVGGVPVGISVGSTWTDDPAADADELVRAADAAMYDVKGGWRVRQPRSRRRREVALDRAAYLRERREAEDRLREAEERFRSAFEDAPIGMAIAEADEAGTGRLVRANRALTCILGVPADALAGSRLGARLDDDDARRLVAAVAQTVRGSPPRDGLELRHRRPDGTLGWLMVHVSLLRGSADEVRTALLQVLDMTERVEAETALRRSQRLEAHLAAIVQSSDDAILSKDPDGVITSWNAAAELLYGHTAEEALGRPVTMLIPDEDEYGRIASELAAGRRITPYATRRRRKDGSLVEVSISISPIRDAAGNAVGAATIARDITQRRAAEDALRRSEERYRTLVSQLPRAAVYEYDRDLRLVRAEGTLLPRLVPDRTALVGRTVWELLPPDRATQFAAHCRMALRGVAQRFEWEGSGDNAGIIMDVDMVPRLDGDAPTGVLVLVRDVSESRRTERELHVQAQLLDRLDAAVIATDAEGLVTHWNRHAEVLYARPCGEALGRPVADLNAEHGLPHPASDMDALRGGETLQREVDVRLADGRLVPVLLTSGRVLDESGAVIGFTGIGVDVTPLRRAADELHGARELFESAFQTAPIGMAILAVEDGWPAAVLRVNAALGAMLGAPPGELVGRRLEHIVDPGDAEQLGAEIARLMTGEQRDVRLEARLCAAESRTVHAEVGVALVRDRDGVPLRAVALVEDVTRRREDQADKEGLEARLRQSDKLDGIGRLAGGIAHDFNNLLAVIGTYADLVAEELPQGELRADVEQIRRATDRAAALTRRLLVFGRREIARPVPVDVNAVVADTHRLLGRTIGEDVELRLALHEGEVTILADPGQLEQVLLNLAVNARDAMPAGGLMTIRTACESLDADRAATAGVVPGPYVRLEVTDTGCGITPEVGARMFEPFFTTKPVGEGTGLGLATVYAIATGAGGCVDYSSEPGAGTTLAVVLPAGDGPVTRVDPGERDLPAGRGETVLLVEDDAAVRELAGRLLADGGYRVLAAPGAEEARRHAERADIDLLLTDVVMPGTSGTDLAAQLRAERPRLRVVFMSGHTDDLVMRHGISERRVAFLDKPFSRGSLLREVRAALDAPREAGHGGR